jgi:hypothetical protein
MIQCQKKCSGEPFGLSNVLLANESAAHLCSRDAAHLCSRDAPYWSAALWSVTWDVWKRGRGVVWGLEFACSMEVWCTLWIHTPPANGDKNVLCLDAKCTVISGKNIWPKTNASTARLLVVKLLNLSQAKWTSLECRKSFQCEFSVHIRNRHPGVSWRWAYPLCGWSWM